MSVGSDQVSFLIIILEIYVNRARCSSLEPARASSMLVAVLQERRVLSKHAQRKRSCFITIYYIFTLCKSKYKLRDTYHKQLRENICKISNLDPRSRVRYIIVGTLKVKGHEEGHRTDKDMFGGINRERS